MSYTKAETLFLIFFAFIVSACSNSKHLPGHDSLFRGSKVHINDKEVPAKDKKALQNDLAANVRPKTNNKTLGIRLKLSIYNLAGETKKKRGIKQWLRNKVGEPPVLASSVNLNFNKGLMVNYLQNRGYFSATASARIDIDKEKKATAVFEVTTGPQYKINKAYFDRDSSEIGRKIDSEFTKTLLKPDAPYNLELIKGERTRIDAELKEMGYFFFKPDYILVLVDSSIGNHKVNMYVKLKKKEIPEDVYSEYTVNDIFVFADYKLQGAAADTSKANAVVVDNYKIIDNEKVFNPVIFSKGIIIEKGDKYNLDDQNTTLSRLVNMGVFKFVKNRFEPVGDSLLNVYYYLTPYPKKSLRFEVGALTQNDDRAGTEGNISWRNRNTFKGAEELLFKISGGFEAQYTGNGSEPNIYNFGAETDLSFPRFEIPFFHVQTSSQYLPRSIIKLKYNFESESDLLRINSYTASYGYDWKEGPHKEHQFYPLNFTYVKTDTFNVENANLLYGNLLFDGIIIGPTYEFTYNSQNGIAKKNAYYFDGLIDIAGNVMGQLENANYENNPRTFLGSTYAEYVKLQPDFRYYRKLTRVTSFATRLMAGIGIPYGNSNELPNIKQFWAGGNSDLRGFPSRLVGPGTFNAITDTPNTGKYIETLGDMKLEFNAEIRQNIYKFLNCAFFYDAGNIWLYHGNPALPGSGFTSDFYNQFAADIGFGLRFDFKILILRLDLGMPVREPWLPENDRWVFKEIDFGNSEWRKQNLVLNIGIGYPF